MHFWDAFILGCIQGITEFLPVSSTAHASVYRELFSLHHFGKNFDIILNLGTLLAILLYFRREFLNLFFGGLDFLCNKKTENRNIFLTILLADLPTIIVFGILEFFEFEANSVLLTGINLVTFGVVLYLCDQEKPTKSGITMKDGIKVGVVQLLSIFPGVSRLGICLSMCRYLGYDRKESFRFSMILSIPPIAGACLLKLMKMLTHSEISYALNDLFIGIISAFIFGIISLNIIFVFLKAHTFSPIIIYRITFGIVIVLLYFFR